MDAKLEKAYADFDKCSMNISVGGDSAYSVADAQSDILLSVAPEIRQCFRILDFGCGIGRSLPLLFNKIGSASLELNGADISQDFIDSARVILKDFPFKFFKITGQNSHYNSFRLSENNDHLPNRYYDFCFSFSVFTHLDSTMAREALCRVEKTLKPGGLYYFTLFRLDQDSRAAINSQSSALPFQFNRIVQADEREYFANLDDPLAFSAIDQDSIEDSIAFASFETVKFIEGAWRGKPVANIHDAYLIMR